MLFDKIVRVCEATEAYILKPVRNRRSVSAGRGEASFGTILPGVSYERCTAGTDEPAQFAQRPNTPSKQYLL